MKTILLAGMLALAGMLSGCATTGAGGAAAAIGERAGPTAETAYQAQVNLGLAMIANGNTTPAKLREVDNKVYLGLLAVRTGYALGFPLGASSPPYLDAIAASDEMHFRVQTAN